MFGALLRRAFTFCWWTRGKSNPGLPRVRRAVLREIEAIRAHVLAEGVGLEPTRPLGLTRFRDGLPFQQEPLRAYHNPRRHALNRQVCPVR